MPMPRVSSVSFRIESTHQGVGAHGYSDARVLALLILSGTISAPIIRYAARRFHATVQAFVRIIHLHILSPDPFFTIIFPLPCPIKWHFFLEITFGSTPSPEFFQSGGTEWCVYVQLFHETEFAF